MSEPWPAIQNEDTRVRTVTCDQVLIRLLKARLIYDFARLSVSHAGERTAERKRGWRMEDIGKNCN